MVIGIDAYFLYEKNNTGIGILTSNIIKVLSRIDKENKYVLFTPKITHIAIANEILKNENFKIVEFSGFFCKYRRLWLQNPGLIARILREGVDIFWGGGEYIPIFLPKKMRKIVSIHDVVFLIFPETIRFIDKILYKTLFLLCIKKADAIITVSNSSKREILEYLNPQKPIFVAYNGIPIEKYTPQKNFKKGNYILFVGTLQPRKNLINVLKAFELIVKEVDCELRIVGASGWKNSNLRRYVERIEPAIRCKIHFLGYVDNESLIELYRKAKVFVAPSLHEGFGLIILEALASGAPVVSSQRGAIPEVFANSVEYADPLNPDDIKNKVVKILHEKEQQYRMIRQGLKFAKKYDITRTALCYMDIFREVYRNCKK